MKTDGLFDYRIIEVSFQDFNKPISLYLPADIHFNSKNFADRAFDEFIEEVEADENQKLFLTVGDMLETCASSDRRIILSGDTKDGAIDTLEAKISDDLDRLINRIKPHMVNKTVGVIGGNHYWEFQDDKTTTEQRLAKALKSTYIGCAGFINLVLRYRKSAFTQDFLIFAIHSASDARLKNLRADIDADLIVGAHTHDSFAKPKPRLKFKRGVGTTGKVYQHETKVIRCKSFLKTWCAGTRSYGHDAAYSPVSLGCAKAIITPRRRQGQENNVRYDERWIDCKAVV